MTKKFYLMSGHSSKGELKCIDMAALSDADNRNILVLNLSFGDREKLQQKREFFREYFAGIGANQIKFIEPETPQVQIDELFEKTGLLYLPGGDTKTLISNLKRKGLDSQIESFNGIISGNSAGAHALCPEYLRIGHEDVGIVPALNMVDFWTKANYKPEFDHTLKILSQSREIYAMGNGSAIICNGAKKFIGDVWKFSKNLKEKVN